MYVLASVSEATTQPITRSICCALRKCHGTLVSRLVASASMRLLSEMSITAARRPSRISLYRSAMVSRLSCNHCSGLAVLYSGHASK